MDFWDGVGIVVAAVIWVGGLIYLGTPPRRKTPENIQPPKGGSVMTRRD